MAAQRAQDVSPAGELQHINRLFTHFQIIDATGEGLSRSVFVIVREQRAGFVSTDREFFQREFVVTGRESNAILLVFARVVHQVGVGGDLGRLDLDGAVSGHLVDVIALLRPSPSVLTTPSQPAGRFMLYLPSGSSKTSVALCANAARANQGANKNNSEQRRDGRITTRLPSN